MKSIIIHEKYNNTVIQKKYGIDVNFQHSANNGSSTKLGPFHVLIVFGKMINYTDKSLVLVE